MAQLNISDELYTRLKTLAQQNKTTIEALIETGTETPLQPDFRTGLDLIELVADAIVTIDTHQTIVNFNKGAEALFGYKEVDIVGKSLDVLIPEHLRSSHCKYTNQFQIGDIHHIYMKDRDELLARKKDGSHFYADISLAKYTSQGSDYVMAIIRELSPLRELINRLQESESQLRLMADYATDLICLHSPDGTYEFVSKSASKIIGYAPEELIGKSPYDYFHPDDIPAIGDNHAQTQVGNPDTRITYRFRKKSGDYIWFETITKPVIDENDGLTHLVTISRDVSAMQQAQSDLKKERDFIHNIMEMSPSAITVLSPDGQITLTNKRAEDVLGIRKENITSRSYDAPDWKHTDYDGNPWPDEKQPFVRVMTTKQAVWDVRHAIEKPDGERIYLAINGMPVFDEDGEISTTIFTVEDYTERKIQQDELEASLAREKKLNKMKSEFLSIVSHEFKTPLSIILSSTGLIRLKHQDLSPESLQERIKRIERQVKRLNRLINDVTLITREQTIEHLITLTPINLQQFFEEMANDLHPTYSEIGNIRIIREGTNETISSDSQLIHYIFDNLLSNAMKYSRSGGTIEIRYSIDDKETTVLISDEGIGIPRDDQRKLFDVFHRASNVGSISGTGLGLAIVKSSLDALDGTITFESAENEGTQVLVKLPINPTNNKGKQ